MSTIEIFLVALDEPALSCETLAEWLDAEERARLASFERARPRRRYLAAHAALRLILGRILGRRPAEIEFRRNAWGRPETSGGPSFNMSHGGARALVAVADKGSIGVDIECGDKNVSAEVFDAVASDAELLASPGRRLERADRLWLWVRKEAVLKAFGRGLSFSPRALTVGAHAPDAGFWRKATLVEQDVVRDFSFIDLALPFRSVGALAIGGCAGEPRKVDIRPLTI